MGPIGSAVLTFIGYKQTNKQTDRQTDKPNLYIDGAAYKNWVMNIFSIVRSPKLKFVFKKITCAPKSFIVYLIRHKILYKMYGDELEPKINTTRKGKMLICKMELLKED